MKTMFHFSLYFHLNLFQALLVGVRIIWAFPDQAKWSFTADAENCHYFSAHSSLYANSSITLQIQCDSETLSANQPNKINIGLLVRSSPCYEEYFGSEYLLKDYFKWYYYCPASLFGDFGYKSVKYFKTTEFETTCNHLVDLTPIHGKFVQENIDPITDQQCRIDDTDCDSSTSVRQYFSESKNARQINDGYSINVPDDGIYLFIVFVRFENSNPKRPNITVDINFESDSGQYLSAVDYPLLNFYAFMCFIYFIFATIWSIISFVRWKELLKIQFFIAAVILLGMIEKAIFYGVYQSLNSNGVLNQNLFYMAEIFSCLKRTVARILIIIVSCGFEIIRPHLGSDRLKIILIGTLYFILGTFESTIRIYRAKNDLSNGSLFAEVPLALLDSIICWWIFNNLVQTTKILRLRRNCVKLELFQKLTNVLVFAVLASIGFMIWQIHSHKLTNCLHNWKYLWIDEAFWHILFSLMLLAIMVLWRPSNNNQRYAFTALMDESQHDLIQNQHLTTDASINSTDNEQCLIESFGEMKMRFQKSNRSANHDSNNVLKNHRTGDDIISNETFDNLKWIEENISTTLVDTSLPSLIDSDEDLINTRFEISKIQ